jgi:acyl carrier protein
VTDIGDLIGLLRDELGLPVTIEDVELDLHDLPGWDSTHLLWLLARLEQWTGRSLRVSDLFEAPNLQHIYGLVASDRLVGEDLG